ncbi:hypothetical protein D9M68_875700 [compost metagenome]
MTQRLTTAELRIESHILRQVAQLTADIAGPWVAPEHLNSPHAGLQQAKDQLHGRGLAGAVMAEQAQHLPFTQIQVQIMQHGHIAVTMADALDLDGIHE